MRQFLIITALTLALHQPAQAASFKATFTTQVNEVSGLTVISAEKSKRRIKIRRRGTTLNIRWRGPRGKRFFFSLKQLQPGVFFIQQDAVVGDDPNCTVTTTAAWRDDSEKNASFIRREIKSCNDGRLQDLTTTGTLRRLRR